MKKKFVTLVLCVFFFGVSAQNKNDIEKYTSQKPQYGFVENKGQIHDQNYGANPNVKYLLCLGNGMNVQLKANGFSYDTYKTEVKERTITIHSINCGQMMNREKRSLIIFTGLMSNW